MSKTVTLIYPFEIKELDLQFDLQVKTVMDTNNMDEFLDKIHDVGGYYGPNGYFTDDEIKQLGEIYENLCHQLEAINSFSETRRKKLQKQIKHFEKYVIRQEEDEISRYFFTDANFPMYKSLEKVDTDTYKVLYEST
jgi:hypothetical protein